MDVPAPADWGQGFFENPSWLALRSSTLASPGTVEWSSPGSGGTVLGPLVPLKAEKALV